jgi:hypothetical protein
LGLPCKSLLKLEDTFWKEQGLVSLAEIKFQKLKNVALTAPPLFFQPFSVHEYKRPPLPTRRTT